VIQQGRSLATRVSSLRDDYNVMLQEVDRALGASIEKANDTLTQIAQINGQIANIENAGGGQASSLRDQRDILIDELSQYVDVSVIEPAGGGGAVNIYVGSEPILLGSMSRGIELRTDSVDGQTEVSMRVAADGTKILVDSGSIGGLLRQREETVRPAIDELNTFAGQLIFQVNRVHSQGQGRSGFASVAGTYPVADATANLNSTAADLPFDVRNGSFFIHVTHTGTGIRTTHQINVDGDSMSLDDLVTQINTVVGVPNVTAGINANRQLTLSANSGYEFSFSDDTSGALAALGVNTFFTGSTAADIDVNQTLLNDPNMLAAGGGHVAGSNTTALTMADLQNVKFTELNGQSLREYWQLSINALAVKADAANSAVESSALVKDSLNAQIQSVSGVSLDEESINLLTYQRQFQAAARFISVIDEAMQTLLSIA